MADYCRRRGGRGPLKGNTTHKRVPYRSRPRSVRDQMKNEGSSSPATSFAIARYFIRGGDPTLRSRERLRYFARKIASFCIFITHAYMVSLHLKENPRERTAIPDQA